MEPCVGDCPFTMNIFLNTFSIYFCEKMHDIQLITY